MILFKSGKKEYIHNFGFTLIELLVVISIIGILSSFAIVSLNSARIKARDALRKGDMAQLRIALSLYYDDYLEYPACGTWDDTELDFGATVGENNGDGSWCYINTLETALISGARPIMMNVPRDPKNPDNIPAPTGDNTYIYRYVSDGTEYAVVYYLEEDLNMQIMRGW